MSETALWHVNMNGDIVYYIHSVSHPNCQTIEIYKTTYCREYSVLGKCRPQLAVLLWVG